MKKIIHLTYNIKPSQCEFNYIIITVEPRYNEVIGTMKITLLYQGEKTRKYKELGPAK